MTAEENTLINDESYFEEVEEMDTDYVPFDETEDIIDQF